MPKYTKEELQRMSAMVVACEHTAPGQVGEFYERLSMEVGISLSAARYRTHALAIGIS